MTNTENTGLVALTEPVVMAFPNLDAPKAIKKNGKEVGAAKFGATFVFEPASVDLKTMKEAAVRAARAKWPTRDLKTLQFPYKAGDALADKRKETSGKDDGDFQRGKVIFKARSQYRPRLSYVENGKLYELQTDAAVLAAKDKFYFGVKVYAQFNFFAYEGGNGPDGVGAYLNMVLSTCQGEKLFSGGASAAEVFAGYLGTVTNENPLGAGGVLDDEISF